MEKTPTSGLKFITNLKNSLCKIKVTRMQNIPNPHSIAIVKLTHVTMCNSNRVRLFYFVNLFGARILNPYLTHHTTF